MKLKSVSRILLGFICSWPTLAQANGTPVTPTSEARVLQKSVLDSKVHGQSASSAVGVTSAAEPDPSSLTLDQRVVAAFLKDDCAEIFKLVPESSYSTVEGRLLAVVASCNPRGKDPEKMFQRARLLAPDDDSLLLLHARYRSQHAIVAANDLWNLIIARTHDTKVKKMAELYVIGDSESAEAVLRERRMSISGFVQAGAIYETNPTLISNPDKLPDGLHSSFGGASAGLIKVSKGNSVGSSGLDYFFSQTSYAMSHESDLFSHELGLPVSIEASHESEILVRPYLNQTLLSSTNYLSDYGASLTRADSLHGLNQTVSAILYYEHYYQAEDQPQQGTHVKFEYGLHPRANPIINADAQFFVDHASVGKDDSYANQSLPYSNFTYGALLSVASKGLVSFGLNATLSYRIDDNQSMFLSQVDQASVTTRREDFSVQLQPYVSFTFGRNRQWETLASYQYSRVKSNLGSSDYLDRNSLNQSYTITLRRYFED